MTMATMLNISQRCLLPNTVPCDDRKRRRRIRPFLRIFVAWDAPVLIVLLLQQLRMWTSDATPSYLVTLQPRSEENEAEECFEFRVPSDTPYIVSGNFDCWEEGDAFVRECRHVEGWIERITSLDIEENEQPSHPWRSTPGVSEEAFHIQVQGVPSKYRLCFAASEGEDEEEDDSLVARRFQLGFHLRVQSALQRALPDQELGPDALRAVSLLEAATEAEQHWHHLMDHFEFLGNREGVQWQLMHQTFARIMGWTILEAILVVAMAVAQVCYWKSFFEQRRYL